MQFQVKIQAGIPPKLLDFNSAQDEGDADQLSKQNIEQSAVHEEFKGWLGHENDLGVLQDA